LERVIYERCRQLQFAATLTSFHTADLRSADFRPVLDGMLDASPDLAWVGFVDSAGAVISGTQGVLEKTSVAETVWFRGARERAYVGVREDLDLARQFRNPGEDSFSRFVELAVPVTDGKGRFIGVLAALTRWSTLRAIQLSVVPDATQRDRLGVTLYALNGDILLDSGGAGWSAPPPVPSLPEQRRYRGSLVEPSSTGPAFLTGYSRGRGFRDYRGLGWLVTVRQPAAIAFAPASALQRAIVDWGLVFTCILAIAGWLVAARLARRLALVAAAANRIRDGDVLAVIPLPHGDSEMEKMCGAVGELVEDFRQKEEKQKASEPRVRDPRPY
jgi:HAMP domain-containing protein